MLFSYWLLAAGGSVLGAAKKSRSFASLRMTKFVEMTKVVEKLALARSSKLVACG